MGIQLPAGAAEMAVADALRADLPEDIHLQGGIDADHLVVLPDHVFGSLVTAPLLEFDAQVVVDKVIQFLGAQGKGADHLALPERLAAVGDDARLRTDPPCHR